MNNNNNNVINNINFNSQNFNSKTIIYQDKDLPPEKDPNAIIVSFTFKSNNKQIFIEINPNKTFGFAIKELERKYKITINPNFKYYFNKKEITKNDFRRTLNQLYIDDCSDISILDY